MGRTVPVVGALVVALMVPFAIVAQPTDAWVGTWKVNLSKSTYRPGPPPKSNAYSYEPVAGGATKIVFDGVNAQGQPTHSERVTKFDGKPSPVQASQTTARGTIDTWKRIDDHTFEIDVKRPGTPFSLTVRGVVSPDGKTLTQTQKGTDPDGKAVDSTIVSDKQ